MPYLHDSLMNWRTRLVARKIPANKWNWDANDIAAVFSGSTPTSAGARMKAFWRAAQTARGEIE